jgi:hypothetical protein
MGVTDPAGSVTSRDHDAALRLVREVDARRGVVFLARTNPQATGTPSANNALLTPPIGCNTREASANRLRIAIATL